MAKIEEKVEQLVKDPIEKLGYSLYDVEYVKEGPEYYLRIYIDKESGIDLNDCEKVSNEINEIYVIAFECLYKEDGETPAYVIYEENMLCLSSINALTQMCQEVIDNYYCELTSEIQKELEEE